MPLSAAAPSDSALSTAKATARAVDLGPLPEWDLSDLYAGLDDPAFAADLDRAEAECRSFAESYRGRVRDLVAGEGASDRLGTAVAAYEAIEDRLGRLMSYAGLVYSGDTTDPARAKFYGDTQERLTTASSDLLFFTLELNRVEDALIDAAAAHPPLARYRPWLEDIRREKPHQLSDETEKLFLEKSVTGRAAWNRLFDETIASLRFPLRGEELTLEPTLNKLQDPDETVRRDAAGALSSVFRSNLRVFTLITNTLAKDKEISDRWRGFSDVSDARHLANRVERDTVEALVAAVQAAYPRLSHRYYTLKARWFGREDLAYWDRNAPLPKWSSARSRGPRRARPCCRLRRLLAEDGRDRPALLRRRLDRRAGAARQGAGRLRPPDRALGPPVRAGQLPGQARDVMTLAHELGHGVHQVLAGHNGALMAPTPLTLAETASVFGEMLTFRRVLEATTDPVQRRAMLAAKVEDMINTVVRQIAFYSFERKVHLARREGELTADTINALWMSVQAESLGPAIRIDEGYEPYWAYIPHFIHSPFYVYAYAFGDCLVNSLYGVYQGASGDPAAEQAFVERYFALLAAGGSQPYGELLAPFGLDARDPAFWQIGLSMIEGMIAELEAMEA